MKRAIITGAGSGIGHALCEKLKSSYEVYGVDRKTCDLTGDLSSMDTGNVDLLVNCAGVGYYGLHENLTPVQIEEMVRVNLEVPLILTNLCLPYLKKNKGIIVNISSITADGVNTHGCAYGATKAGLSNFSKSLFAEIRKSGVRVIDVKPDMTDTNLYRHSDFGVSDNREAYLTADEVADTIVDAINNKAITELRLQPQKHQLGAAPNCQKI
ncbi:MAG: SDR family oxidoreductase [Coriobacteriia bacterium]|nr:SDR family oxidoreductase [Coriobacteriia bacterium]